MTFSAFIHTESFPIAYASRFLVFRQKYGKYPSDMSRKKKRRKIYCKRGKKSTSHRRDISEKGFRQQKVLTPYVFRK